MDPPRCRFPHGFGLAPRSCSSASFRHCHYCHHFDFYADYDYDVCAEYDDSQNSDDSNDDGYRDHEINPPDGDDDTDNFGDDHADD